MAALARLLKRLGTLPQTDGGGWSVVSCLFRNDSDEHRIARVDGSVKIWAAHGYWQWMKAGLATQLFWPILDELGMFGDYKDSTGSINDGEVYFLLCSLNILA